MIPSHITVAAIAALIAALATWFFQANHYEAKLLELRLQHADAVIRAAAQERIKQQATRRPSMPQPPAHLFFAATLTLLALSLSACAHNSKPPPCSCPALPAPPSVSTQQPSQDYSISAQALIKTWRDKLRATPLTQD